MFHNKKIVVVGGGSGIGFGLSGRLLAEGIENVMASGSEDKLQNAKKKLKDAVIMSAIKSR